MTQPLFPPPAEPANEGVLIDDEGFPYVPQQTPSVEGKWVQPAFRVSPCCYSACSVGDAGVYCKKCYMPTLDECLWDPEGAIAPSPAGNAPALAAAAAAQNTTVAALALED